MEIKAQIVADSLNKQGNRITTFLLTYPRIIHAELLTHRAFSRNAASSRAIPTKKMIGSIRQEPFIPIAWQKNHSGMQGTEYLNEEDSAQARELWINAKTNALISCQQMIDNDVTKQIANRLLEPFQYYTSLVTATDFENFFELRCPQYIFHNEDEEFTFRSRKDVVKHFGEDETVEYEIGNIAFKDLTDLQWLELNKGAAEIHLMDLAEKMWDAYNENTPKVLKEGEWHIPFEEKILEPKIDKILHEENPDGFRKQSHYISALAMTKVKVSTAMAARTSYTVVGDEKEVSYETLIGIHDRIVKARPMHASPLEHCARANSGERSRNFVGFTQYREIVENSL